MKSGWVDRDAETLVADGAKSGIDRDLALRVYTTRLLGRDRKLVLHGGGNTSLKAAHARPPRRRGRGFARKSLRRRHGDDRARRASGRAACPHAQAARARSYRRRGTGRHRARQPDRSNGCKSVRRDDAARLPAAQIRRSHPRHRGAQPDRSAGRREKMRRGFCRAAGICALSHAGLRPGEEGDRSF